MNALAQLTTWLKEKRANAREIDETMIEMLEQVEGKVPSFSEIMTYGRRVDSGFGDRTHFYWHDEPLFRVDWKPFRIVRFR